MTSPARLRVGQMGLAIAVVLFGAVGCAQRSDVGNGGDVSQPATQVNFHDSGADATVTAGNTIASLRLRVGAPQVASQVAEARACTIQFRGDGLARAAAVPVEINGDETSGGPVPFVVRLGNLKALGSGGAVTLAGAVHWSVHYSGVPQECDQGGDLMGIPATVKWTNGSGGPWTAWLLVPDAITPDDPTGKRTVGSLVLEPVVSLGDQTVVPDWSSSGHNVVSCSAQDPAAGGEYYVAVDPAVAADHGCTTNVESAGQQATDVICLRRYPATDHDSTTVGSVTTYGRQQSHFQVCDGFGTGDNHVTMTQAMRCAVVGLGASYLGEQLPDLNTAKDLCDDAKVVDQLSRGAFLDAAGQQACNWWADVFSEQTGAWAAGEVALTVADPVAIAIGVAAAGALKAGLGEACGGDLLQDFRALGGRLENGHLADIAHDVMANGQCIRHDSHPAIGQDGWSATTCSQN